MLAKALMGATSPAGVSATVEYVGYLGSDANASSYTFTGASLGSTGGDRHIILAIGSSVGNSGRNLSSVTIAGVSASAATIVRTGTISGATRLAAIVIASVPTGTTGDIVINFNAGVNRVQLGVYAARNLISATRQAVAGVSSNLSNSTGPFDVSVTGTTAGFVVAVAETPEPNTWTWTGVTEDFDETIEASNAVSGASLNTSSSGTVSITATQSSAGNYAVASAYFG